MMITGAEADAAIRAALSPKDDVLVHASLGRLGMFADGVHSIIRSLLDVVGKGGTVVMMTDTRSFARTGRFSIDQPSETGLLTERFRQMPGVVRSCVPMVSFCALGARQADYVQNYHSLLDLTSPIARLLENDGKILLLGIGYEKCTLYHLSEERLAAPYNDYKTFEGVLIQEGREARPISQRYFVRRELSVKKDPSIAGRMLEERGQVRVIPLGMDAVRVFRARDFDQCCMDALAADPHAFLGQPGIETGTATGKTDESEKGRSNR